MRITLLTLAALTACGGGEIDLSDTGTSSDTGGLEDTGEPLPFSCDRFEVAGSFMPPADAVLPSGDVTVEILAIELAEGIPEIGPLASVTVGPMTAGEALSFQVCIDEEPPAEHIRTPDGASPKLELATYVIVAHAETDGEGSGLVGASFPRLLAHVGGEIPTELTDQGVAAGWNDMLLSESFFASAEPIASGDVMDLDANLLIERRGGLRATVVPNLSAATAPTGALFSILHIIDPSLPAPVKAMIAETPLTLATGNAAVELVEADYPPADHLTASPDFPFVGLGLYQGMVFADGNGSGTLEIGEATLASSLAGANARAGVFIEPRDWRAAIYVVQGIPFGWSLSENDAFIDWSTGVFLDVD